MRGESIKNLVLGCGAAVAGGLSRTLGGWDPALRLLVAFMAADYVTGLLVAGVWRRSRRSGSGALDSRAGFKGLCRKGAILALIWVGTLLDRTLGAPYVRTALCFFFTGNEGLSLLENLGLMGVPFPAFLRRALEALEERGDKGDGTAA